MTDGVPESEGIVRRTLRKSTETGMTWGTAAGNVFCPVCPLLFTYHSGKFLFIIFICGKKCEWHELQPITNNGAMCL